MIELLTSVFRPLFDLVPRLSRRPATTEWCVVDSWLRSPRIATGPVLFCPTLTHVEYYPLTPFPVDLEVQTLQYASGDEVTVNAAVMIAIVDPLVLREALGEDYLSCISMAARSVIQSAVSETDCISSDPDSLHRDISSDLSHLSNNGVVLERLCIEDAAKTSSLRLYGHSVPF